MASPTEDLFGGQGLMETKDHMFQPNRDTWADPAAYDAQAAKLVAMFADNFGQYVPHIGDDVKAAAIG